MGRGHSSQRERQSKDLGMRTVGAVWLTGRSVTMEGRQWVGVLVCGTLIMGPRCLDFICGHREQLCCLRRGAVARATFQTRWWWMGGGGVGGRGCDPPALWGRLDVMW